METMLHNRSGFTLVELMITLVLSMVIIAAIYSAHLTQQRTQTAQDQVVEMQQNLRASLNLIVSELRMAGFDPSGSANVGITGANQGWMQVTMDLNGDGDAGDSNEDVQFGFNDADDATDDGVADDGVASLGRNTGGGYQPIADNIVAIEFLYHLENGSKDPTTYSYTRNPTAAELDTIRAVTISLLSRARNLDPNFTSNQSALPASALTASPAGNSGDNASWNASGVSWNVASNFRRRLLIMTVKLRNLGL